MQFRNRDWRNYGEDEDHQTLEQIASRDFFIAAVAVRCHLKARMLGRKVSPKKIRALR